MEEEHERLRVLRSWLYPNRSHGIGPTLLNNGSFMITAAFNGLARARPLDVLVSSAPPFLSQIAGETIRLIRRVPTVLEIRDLWPDYLMEMGILPEGLATRALFGLERWLLRHSDRVVVVTESFRRRVEAKGVPPDRIDVIPNGVDVQFYRYISDAPPLQALRRRGPGDFVVGYLGNFGAGQDLRTLVDAAAILQRTDPGVRMVLAGDGREKDRVVAHAREVGVAGLEILPSIPKADTPGFYSACDICVVPLAPLRVLEDTIASKVFEVLACERPVVASVAGETARIVRESGAGLVAAPGGAEGIAAAIRRLRSRSDEERRDLGSRGRRYVEQRYDRGVLARRYLEILRTAARK